MIRTHRAWDDGMIRSDENLDWHWNRFNQCETKINFKKKKNRPSRTRTRKLPFTNRAQRLVLLNFNKINASQRAHKFASNVVGWRSSRTRSASFEACRPPSPSASRSELCRCESCRVLCLRPDAIAAPVRLRPFALLFAVRICRTCQCKKGPSETRRNRTPKLWMACVLWWLRDDGILGHGERSRRKFETSHANMIR